MRLDRSDEVSAKVVVDVVLLEEFKDLYVGLENQDCAQWQQWQLFSVEMDVEVFKCMFGTAFGFRCSVQSSLRLSNRLVV